MEPARRGAEQEEEKQRALLPRGARGNPQTQQDSLPRNRHATALITRKQNLSSPKKQFLLRSRYLCPPPPPNSYVEDLNVMILGDGPLRSSEFTEDMGPSRWAPWPAKRRQGEGGRLQARKRSVTRDHPAGSWSGTLSLHTVRK